MASGLKYPIIHPGGLLPHPGPKRESCEGGKRELVVGVDDEHLNADDRTIPREDLAEVTVQCLTCPSCINTSWDLVSKKEGKAWCFPRSPSSCSPPRAFTATLVSQTWTPC